MTLRSQITAVLVLIITLLAAGLAWQQVRSIRASLAEQIETAGQIATQVISGVNEIYKAEGSRPMKKFLSQLGRLRAHDIILVDLHGSVIYRAPASQYKADQSAPDWFVKMVAPEQSVRAFSLSNAQLLLRGDARRATLEGWADFKLLMAGIAIGFVLINLFAYWLVGRAMAPFNRVTSALLAVEKGDFSTRLPELPGAEANAIGTAFNTMVSSVDDSIAAREAAAVANVKLAQSRELTQEIQQGIEHEQRSLAQELHDELGQHVTAIKSLGVSISRRCDNANPDMAKAALLIVESADRIHAAMRQMLTRLRPASLDQFGLVDALNDLVSDWSIKQPEKQFVFNQLDVATGQDPGKLSPLVATAAYRIAQESVTNAVRHSGASRIDIRLQLDDQLKLQIEDDGKGLKNANSGTRFGLTGMIERAAAINGKLEIGSSDSGGVLVAAILPIAGKLEIDNGITKNTKI
ncbi:MAG: sensor histidine kinase [Granulosicoccus sp.]